MRARHYEQGSVTALVVSLTMTFVACCALAVDGGRLVAAYVQLSDHAGNAARRGVQEVTSLRSGDPIIDGERARRVANAYLSQNGLQGEVLAEDRAVTVGITTSVKMAMLGVFGIGDRRVTVSRTAVPAVGP
jgi:Flp pilus assembly protein TadG